MPKAVTSFLLEGLQQQNSRKNFAWIIAGFRLFACLLQIFLLFSRRLFTLACHDAIGGGMGELIELKNMFWQLAGDHFDDCQLIILFCGLVGIPNFKLGYIQLMLQNLHSDFEIFLQYFINAAKNLNELPVHISGVRTADYKNGTNGWIGESPGHMDP